MRSISKPNHHHHRITKPDNRTTDKTHWKTRSGCFRFFSFQRTVRGASWCPSCFVCVLCVVCIRRRCPAHWVFVCVSVCVCLHNVMSTYPCRWHVASLHSITLPKHTIHTVCWVRTMRYVCGLMAIQLGWSARARNLFTLISWLLCVPWIDIHIILYIFSFQFPQEYVRTGCMYGPYALCLDHNIRGSDILSDRSASYYIWYCPQRMESRTHLFKHTIYCT